MIKSQPLSDHAPPFKRARPALGTLLEITLGDVSWERGAAVTNLAFQEAERLERLLSRYDPSSQVSWINRERTVLLSGLSPEVRSTLESASWLETEHRVWGFRACPGCRAETGPCLEWELDATGQKSRMRLAHPREAGCEIDLGGIAKGTIVDRVFETVLFELGSDPTTVLVSAGGDLRCRGSHEIEVRIPSLQGERRFLIQLKDQSLATSSLLGAESAVGEAIARYRSPLQVEIGEESLSSACVIGTECRWTDAYTKCALFGGRSFWSSTLPEGIAGVLGFNEFGQRVSERWSQP